MHTTKRFITPMWHTAASMKSSMDKRNKSPTSLIKDDEIKAQSPQQSIIRFDDHRVRPQRSPSFTGRILNLQLRTVGMAECTATSV
jgi:hypothetical protein